MPHVSSLDIVIRILLSTVVAGLIGYNREQHSHPAGMRTHILVSIGACILALTQLVVCNQLMSFAIHNPGFGKVMSTDPTRLTAQIVSGIGFLGVGTIVVTRRFVSGVTTAASLWTTAAIGLTIGMGYYQIAMIGSVLVILDLMVLHYIVPFDPIRKVEIKFYNGPVTTGYLDKYFDEKAIGANHTGYKATNYSRDVEKRIYTSIYTVKLPRSMTYSQMISDLAKNPDIVQITVIAM